MPLKQIGGHVQTQCITVALRNICRDYPAGSGVLRELLQNADDAGATVVRFILDEETHPTSPLIDTELAEFQGPALLAYNNAVFRDDDFISLANVGDSSKLQDGLTTGKFGRGFNSVYNYTDSPSIVSRERLLFLDPHQRWSKSTDDPGGPMYDFVQDSDEPETKNHMDAFKLSMIDTTQPLAGTIIRIPLRTKQQAVNSKISNRETTVAEIRGVLENFATEFGSSGLLFMRNIEEIHLATSSGFSTTTQIKNLKELSTNKAKIRDAIKDAFDKSSSYEHSFEAEIECNSADGSSTTRFAVHHSISPGPENKLLKDWAKEQQYIPWVSVAAQIPLPDTFRGSLFTVLPLPILSSQPVHIHALFSLSPDRARLHELNAAVFDQLPAEWNTWLYQSSIPSAWAKLLSFISHRNPQIASYGWWPYPSDSSNPSCNSQNHVVDIIVRDSLPLWHTEVGYVNTSDGLLAGNLTTALKLALRETKLPIVYMPEHLRSKAELVFANRLLSPQILCSALQGNTQLPFWSSSTKQTILEYLVVSHPQLADFGNLKLFPFRDGIYRAIHGHNTFMSRDELESSLFDRDTAHSIDVTKLSTPTTSALRKHCELGNGHTSIRFRTTEDFKEYCVTTVFNSVKANQDEATLGPEAARLVSKAWEWIIQQEHNILGDEFSKLWLIPLTNGRHRQIKPSNPTSEVILAPAGEFGDALRKLDVTGSKAAPLLDTKSLTCGTQVLHILEQAANTSARLSILAGDNIVHFAQWLSKNKDIVNASSEEEKANLIKLLALNLSVITGQSAHNCGNIRLALESLRIFRRISWKSENKKDIPILAWTSLDASPTSVGFLGGLVAIPELPNTQFLVLQSFDNSRLLIEGLGIAKCLDIVSVLEQHIIPAWQNGTDADWSYSCKERVAMLLLGQHSCLSPTWQNALSTLPIIPVENSSGNPALRLSVASTLIDPTVTHLRELFFDNEEYLPQSLYFKQFSAAMIGSGLKSVLDEDLALDRISVYASGTHHLDEVKIRAHALLDSMCIPKRSSVLDFSHHKWLPIKDLDGIEILIAPNQCRGRTSRTLIGFQMPIFDRPVSSDWEQRLGWKSSLSNSMLVAQLNEGLKRKDRAVVDAVLRYVMEEAKLDEVASQLLELKLVPIGDGAYVLPSQALLPAGLNVRLDRLSPYLGMVEDRFRKEHKTLLTRLRVKEGLSLEDLLGVQRQLEAKLPLQASDITVAVELVNLAATSFDRSTLGQLKVVSKDGILFPIAEINYSDHRGLALDHPFNFTHPLISIGTVDALGIEYLKDRLIKEGLEIRDEGDEEDFDQKEQVTTRIADTLERYSSKSTFKEYLANADDAKATKISWLLDERQHAADNLLDEALAAHQGPALLAYNDAIFSEEDFIGFKNVGEGSKMQTQGAIGQFGRGSQTMYHWTDVPMILSGKHFIILDPQRRVLYKNRNTGKRRPGIKILLSKLKNMFPDQLTPFDGLWNYDMGQDYFDGTIFRFPLRTSSTPKTDLTSGRILDREEVMKHMSMYFSEARISLLFLRNVTSIDFSIQGQVASGWAINQPSSNTEWYCETKCSFTNLMSPESPVVGTDDWAVLVVDIEEQTDYLPYRPRRAQKFVECGIAALLKSSSSDSKKELPEVLAPRMFSTLPLPLPSELPVYVHATFSLSGDRQSLNVTEDGSAIDGSKWNQYLLTEALAETYLSFLNALCNRHPKEVFKYWPQEVPTKAHAKMLYKSFWENIPGCEKALYPKAELPSRVKRRHAPESFDIANAVFDCLPKYLSEDLLALLLSMRVKVVSRLTTPLAAELKKLQEFKCIDGALLRSLFGTDSGRDRLQSEISQSPSLLKSILQLAIPVGKSLENLDGCRLVPLADGTLGEFKLRTSEPKVTYYIGTDAEKELFHFGAELLVDPAFGKLLEGLIDSKAFNVEKLGFQHIKTLLDLRDETPGPSLEDADWASKFWKHWNGYHESADLGKTSFDNHLLLRGTSDKTHKWFKISNLHSSPAVVQPTSLKHSEMCQKIPGLYLLDRLKMPSSLRTTESSFGNFEAFLRLTRALQNLAATRYQSLGSLLRNFWDANQLKEFQVFVTTHLNVALDDLKIPNSYQSGSMISELKTIPLWPIDNKTTLVPANGALQVTGSGNLLVPWMANRKCFIDYKFSRDNAVCLKNLDVQQVHLNTLLQSHVLPLPMVDTDDTWSLYCQLMESIAVPRTQVADKILTGSLVAADRLRVLHLPSALFDHKDPLFTAAFRGHEDSLFLNDDLHSHRAFWLTIGLRHRKNGSLVTEDYLKCLKFMARRLADASSDEVKIAAHADARIVLSPLTTPSSSVDSIDDWTTIKQQKVFASQTVFDDAPAYSRSLRVAIAKSRPLLSLNETISKEFVKICWSKIPFPSLQPTKEVLNRTSHRGIPTTTVVWEHLETLSNMVKTLKQEHISDFQTDLQNTYGFLQENSVQSIAAFKQLNLSEKPLWLNLDSFNDSSVSLYAVQNSWNQINDLVLSSACDAGRIKAVAPGLGRYETLLRALGCQSVTYPTVEAPALQTKYMLGTALSSMREDPEFTDIKIVSEGRAIHAHRLVLAACSPKCRRQFGDKWSKEDSIVFDKLRDGAGFLSFHALSTFVRYAYGESIAWHEMEVVETDDFGTRDKKLDLLLDLHKLADCWVVLHLRSLAENKIVAGGRLFITIQNVEKILKRAADVNAQQVEKLCELFISANNATVVRARS